MRVSRPGVRGAESRHREGAILDVDEADDVRVAAGAGHPHVCLERAAHPGDGRGETLNDSQVERRRLHPDIHRVLWRSGDVRARPLLEGAERHGTARGHRHARRLLQRRVERNAVVRVVHVGDERLIRVGLEPSPGHADLAVDPRLLDASRDRGIGSESSAEAPVLEQQRFDLGDVHVARVDLEGACCVRAPRRHRTGHIQRLVAADETEVLDGQIVAAILDGGLAPGGVAPFNPLSRQGEARQMNLLVIGMEHDAPRSGEIPAALLDLGLELEALLRVRRRRRHLVDLRAGDLDEGRIARRLHPGIGEIQFGNGHGVLAREIERFDALKREAVSVERSGRLERLRIAGDSAVQNQGAREPGLAGNAAELGDVRSRRCGT